MMQYRIAEGVKEQRNSIIREVAEAGKKIPGFCTFALGNPAEESIPLDVLKECVYDIIENDPYVAFKYGPIEGDDELKSWIIDRLTNVYNFPKNNNKIMMVAGSGKSLGYVPRIMCESGDEVYFDRFSYPNAYYSVKSIGGVTVPISMDENGMIPEELEKQARRGKGKYIYLIPNFHNPTGITMSLERRKKIYEIACKYDLIIYEDDPYGEIRFEGERIPSIKSFDREDRVIYAGSFSKTFSAGLRVGYTYADEKLSNKLKMVRGGDGQDAVFPQVVIRKCLERMNFDEHLKEIQKVYGEKCKLMLKSLDENLPAGYNVIKPNGGMFVWVDAPNHVNVNALSDACIEAGVGIVKSKAFSVSETDTGNSFRLNFSSSTDEDIVKGVKIIGELAQKL